MATSDPLDTIAKGAQIEGTGNSTIVTAKLIQELCTEFEALPELGPLSKFDAMKDQVVEPIVGQKRNFDDEVAAQSDLAIEDNPQLSFKVVDDANARQNEMAVFEDASHFMCLDTDQLIAERAEWQKIMLEDARELKRLRVRTSEVENKLISTLEANEKLSYDNIDLRHQVDGATVKHEREMSKLLYDFEDALQQIHNLKQQLDHCNKCNTKYEQFFKQLEYKNTVLKTSVDELKDQSANILGLSHDAELRRIRAENRCRQVVGENKVLEANIDRLEEVEEEKNALELKVARLEEALNSQRHAEQHLPPVYESICPISKDGVTGKHVQADGLDKQALELGSLKSALPEVTLALPRPSCGSVRKDGSI